MLHPAGHAVGSWAASAALGAFHGINPAMGWLFAVFLAYQRRSSRALVPALGVVAAGHTLSVAGVALAVGAARALWPVESLRLASGLLLLLFGGYRLVRWYRHPGWRSLNVTWAALLAWSLLAATAHGSGLMLAPLFAGSSGLWETAGMVGMHLAGMALAMSLLAAVVYGRSGVGLLRRVWPNFDVVWGAGLMVTGVVAAFTALA